MSDPTTRLEESVLDAARRFGADLAGIADAEALRRSPSHEILPKLGPYSGVGTLDSDSDGMKVTWPEGARSFVVLGVKHSADEPELDWWRSSLKAGTEGNRRLIGISRRLREWLADEHGIEATPIAYHLEHGGVFLKDAAVLAGLGCLGRNNMLITPDLGPRVRLRALALPVALDPTGPSDFDPCEGCPEPCRGVCPEDAFARCLYSAEEFGLEELPARTGVYDRDACNIRMQADEELAGIGPGEERTDVDPSEAERIVRYCRRCEMACVQGRNV